MWSIASDVVSCLRREQGTSAALLHGHGSRNLLLEVDHEGIIGLLEELQLEIEGIECRMLPSSSFSY